MQGTLGEIRLFAGNFAPLSWAFCHGQEMKVNDHAALFSVLGTYFGGDGRTTFNLPDLRGRVPVGAGDGDGLIPIRLGAAFGQEKSEVGTVSVQSHIPEGKTATTTNCAPGVQELSNHQPSLGLNYIICISGDFPNRD